MSIYDQQDALSVAGNKIRETPLGEIARAPLVDGSARPERERWYARISPLWLCLFVALAIRVWLLLRTHGTMDGDEALLGIQAEHILQGERPIYFYGIPYFGSLEAYIAAGLFALFGPSVAVLRIEASTFGLLLVGATWWLAGLLARAAQLPRYASKWFTTIAALVAALPPLYDGIIEMRTGGGWIESFVLMILLLIAVYRLTSRWHEGASNGELAWRWAVVLEIVRRVRTAEPLLAAGIQALRKLPLLVAALPACTLGFTPGIIWGLQNNWANIHYIFGLGGGWNLKRVETIAKVSTRYIGCVAPRVIGGGTPSEGPLLTILHAPLILIGVGCVLGTMGLVLASFKWHNVLTQRARVLALLPAFFGVCSAVLYCVSSASASILISCNQDFGGHYAAPLVLAMPFLFATVFVLALMFFHERDQQSVEQAVSAHETGAPARVRRSVKVWVALGALLLIYAGGQTVTYGLTNPDLAFQSAYCTIAPANYGPIITYMQQEHISYAWATNLLGNPISFKTNSQIIMADPLVRIHPAITINRIPAYTNAVASADRASFLIFVQHGNTHPRLLQLLDTQQVVYKTAVFPAQPGVDVMVVTPINKTVSPFVSPDFDIFYCSIQ